MGRYVASERRFSVDHEGVILSLGAVPRQPHTLVPHFFEKSTGTETEPRQVSILVSLTIEDCKHPR